MLKITWFGHSMWLIENELVKIVLDPFTDIGYQLPKDLNPDIVIASHDHSDHNNFKMFMKFDNNNRQVQGAFQKISQVGTYKTKGTMIKLIEASHGIVNGKKLGDIYLILIVVDGITILHCSDLGVVPKDDFINDLGQIDILMVPIGGYYTLDASQAKELILQLNPKIVFPMHYHTNNCTIENLEGIEPFLKLFPKVEKNSSNCWLVEGNNLPKTMKIVRLMIDKQ